MMPMCNGWMRAVLGFVLLALAGCGSSHVVVHGTVTANGKNVDEGFISFQPLDDRNPTYGAPIQDGKYSAQVKPGKYAVVVSGGARGPEYPKSQADLKGVPDKNLELVDQVPSDAKGNSQSVEIKAGGQELNITLKYPGPRR